MPSLVVKQTPADLPGEPRREPDRPLYGPVAGHVIPLEAGDVVFGRSAVSLRNHYPGALIVDLPYPAINRIHARIRREGRHYVLEDLQSRNGTFVNGAPVERAILRPDDEIGMTQYVFVFHDSPPGPLDERLPFAKLSAGEY